ncbi:ABC transporter ATP-binding protein [Thomasclavelia saccharogumia]|uniref:ABC transporter ATP-binding protein n=1 Tax=Thomasclavelia saccharogumia TaxID=341225 RepID=UPI000A46FB50|nr:ABC transporter ATP-binding protein [Thomasclavelia saccharogumia]
MKKNGIIKWIYKCSKKYLWMVGLLTIISMAISGSFILMAVVSKKILDIATKSTTGSIINTCIFLFGIIAFQAVANIISNNCRVRSQAKIENSMKEYLLTTLLDKEYQEIITLHSGELMNRFTSDIEIVAGGIVGFIPQIFSLFTKIIAGIWVLFTIDAKFTLIILIIGMITVVCSRLYSKKFRFLHKAVQQSQGVARSFMQECIENVIVIKSFVNENAIKEQLEEKQNYNYQLRVKQNAISNLASTSIYVMMTTGYYVALGWGAIQISKGLLTFGTLTAFLQIIDQIKAPFRNVSGLIPRYDSMIASAARLMEIENLNDESKNHKIENIKCFYDRFEGIGLEHGDFSYDDKEVLKDVSIFIPKGNVIAITGESGNGKTTLFHLLLGLIKLNNGKLFIQTHDDQIMIDAGTRNMFSYVPQGNMILSGTIKENILFGNQNASDKQIEQAIEIACLKDVIDELPEGINTVLKERGIGLSEGQRQRIAVARAIISEAPVLLLDECTASLDGDTEKRLLDNLKNFQQKTVLCISHRSAAIACCDLIIEVKDGKIYYR